MRLDNGTKLGVMKLLVRIETWIHKAPNHLEHEDEGITGNKSHLVPQYHCGSWEVWYGLGDRLLRLGTRKLTKAFFNTTFCLTEQILSAQALISSKN